MKRKVMLSIRGSQAYRDQEPDVIELVTEGQMDFVDGGKFLIGLYVVPGLFHDRRHQRGDLAVVDNYADNRHNIFHTMETSS